MGMKIFRSRQALLVFVCLILVCTGLPAQEASLEAAEPATGGKEAQELPPQGEKEPVSKYKPRQQYLLVDIPLTLAEDTAINLVGNFAWRLWGPDSEVAYFTLDSIRRNLDFANSWHWEEGRGGDAFVTEQMFHPFAGAFYFASARSNNFNYYLSILSTYLGSLQWETFGETGWPSKNDNISATFGGIVIGEVLHRLFLELDKCGTGGRIGASFVSPTDRVTAAIRGYGPEPGPLKISRSSLALGFSWLYARFQETGEETSNWNRPSAFADFTLVYGDPFTAHSKTPFDQFNLDASLMGAIPLVSSVTFMTNGYLASWLLVDDDDEVNQVSNGISIQYDCFSTVKDTFVDLNNGRENLNFAGGSLDYAIKWRHVINPSLEFSAVSYFGLTPWANAGYNGGVDKDDYNLFSYGANIKLFLELRQMKEDQPMKNGQSLALALCFYETWRFPFYGLAFNNYKSFLYSKLTYSLPLTGNLSFYFADNFNFLRVDPIGDYAALNFPPITRYFNNAKIGIKISFM